MDGYHSIYSGGTHPTTGKCVSSFPKGQTRKTYRGIRGATAGSHIRADLTDVSFTATLAEYPSSIHVPAACLGLICVVCGL